MDVPATMYGVRTDTKRLIYRYKILTPGHEFIYLFIYYCFNLSMVTTAIGILAST